MLAFTGDAMIDDWSKTYQSSAPSCSEHETFHYTIGESKNLVELPHVTDVQQILDCVNDFSKFGKW